MTTNQALVKSTRAPVSAREATGAFPTDRHKSVATIPPLTEEQVDQLLAGRGFVGWLRAARVARVLGLFSLYLYLDGYDIRANFKRKLTTRRQSDARALGVWAQLKVRAHHANQFLFDRL